MWLVLLLVATFSCAFGSDLRSQLVDPAWRDVFAAGGMHVRHGRVKRFVELNDSQIGRTRAPQSSQTQMTGAFLTPPTRFGTYFTVSLTDVVAFAKTIYELNSPPNIPYQPCVLPSGTTGHCRYLHFCVQEDFKKDFLKFMDYFCIIKHTAIGVCCPDGIQTAGARAPPGVGGSTALAGDLPATAPRDEDEVALKINRAENRGCGLSTRPHGRVVGSRPANPREWPWMASITPEGYLQYCGGALITDRHVLTAAHCTRRWKAEDLFVRLGEYDFQRTNDSRSYNFRVIEIRQHEYFEISNYHHDVAILKLHRAAVFNTYVWPICLPPPGLNLVEQTAVVIGWGTQWFGGPTSDVLMEVTVPVWNHQTCVDSFSDSVFDETICAGGHEGGKDACQGDSGGPLMYQLPSGRWAVIGIVSWGIRCGEPNHPGLYAQVDKYLDWIVRNAQF